MSWHVACVSEYKLKPYCSGGEACEPLASMFSLAADRAC